MGGGRDPIGAEVGLEDRGHEHRAVLGREQASGRCPASPAASASLREILPLPPHLLLIVLQERNEEAGDSTGCGVHLREGHAQTQLPAGPGRG